MHKFDWYDLATDAMDDAATSLRIGADALRRLPGRKTEVQDIEAMIKRLDAYVAGMQLMLMGDQKYRKHRPDLDVFYE